MISKSTSRSGFTGARWATWTLPLLGGVAWTLLAVVSWRLRGPVNFVDRDDGIITLAHARNLVEFGTVSVGRFGDRVDGFSTPLQFVAALPYFALGGTGYVVLNRLISFITIAAVGALTGVIIGTELRTARAVTKVVALIAAGLLQFASWRFFGWHFSGMENPFTTLLLLGDC